MSTRAMALATIEEFLESHDIDFEKTNDTTYLLTLPGEKKLQTHCALVVGDHSLSINAFVIRKPDENVAAVHEWLLKKNAGMYCRRPTKLISTNLVIFIWLVAYLLVRLLNKS